MTFSCLCARPTCGRCFPSGQVRVKCPACGWRGKQHECDTFVDVNDVPYCDVACPKCECACNEVDED